MEHKPKGEKKITVIYGFRIPLDKTLMLVPFIVIGTYAQFNVKQQSEIL